MIGRRMLLTNTAAVLAMPAIIRQAGAQSSFDWKRFKGQTITVSLTKNPRASRCSRSRCRNSSSARRW
ncbi:MAG TPA: hypothetical protein VL614_12270 [Acetobacteraceae bacterium]|jgi:multiple sugar transport system substrate-binding protein|nr:hypothetical protein [Acetobacteraceae bacterium]